MVTCANDLSDVGLRSKQKQDVIKRHRTDEVQRKPGLEVTNRNPPRFQYNFVFVLVGDYSCYIHADSNKGRRSIRDGLKAVLSRQRQR